MGGLLHCFSHINHPLVIHQSSINHHLSPIIIITHEVSSTLPSQAHLSPGSGLKLLAFDWTSEAG
jgi:hypothetical protein